MIVVDTNVWSEMTKQSPDPRIIAWERENSERLWMSAIVLAEFRAGGALMPNGRNRRLVEAITEQVAALYADRFLPFDDRCTREYGPTLSSARLSGMPIKSADAMIAATARAHGMRVATRDRNDFAGAGVDIIDPWTA